MTVRTAYPVSDLKWVTRAETRLLNGVLAGPNGCWIWAGRPHASGYGCITVSGRKTYVHRLAYAVLVGPLQPEQDVDHICHDPAVCRTGRSCLHRRCLRPDHLEAVSSDENKRRGLLGTVERTGGCRYGHIGEYGPNGNTVKYRACNREREASRRADASR